MDIDLPETAEMTFSAMLSQGWHARSTQSPLSYLRGVQSGLDRFFDANANVASPDLLAKDESRRDAVSLADEMGLVKNLLKSKQSTDPVIVRSALPWSGTHARISYFEVSMINCHPKSQIYIGITPSDHFSWTSLPGHYPQSYGIRSEEGARVGVPKAGKLSVFMPGFNKAGQIVGIGLDHISGRLFVTLNGSFHQDMAYHVKGSFYPTVALHLPNDQVYVNLGQKPFKFDLSAYSKLHEAGLKKDILSSRKSQDQDTDLEIAQLIAQYLAYHGYHGTLDALLHNAKHLRIDASPHRIMPSATFRQELHNAIVEGHLDRATALLLDLYASRESWPTESFTACGAPPASMTTTELLAFIPLTAVFYLQTQRWIALLASRAELSLLTDFIRDNLAPLTTFPSLSDFQSKYLQKLTSLIAYQDVEHLSWSRSLFSQTHREQVAELITAFLIHDFSPQSSDTTIHAACTALEVHMKQLQQVLHHLHEHDRPVTQDNTLSSCHGASKIMASIAETLLLDQLTDNPCFGDNKDELELIGPFQILLKHDAL